MNSITQFVKNRKGNLIGCVVAFSRKNIGWSLCKKGDKFDKNRALDIAAGRAVVSPVTHVSDLDKIPHSVRKCVSYFLQDRCLRYFKS